MGACPCKRYVASPAPLSPLERDRKGRKTDIDETTYACVIASIEIVRKQVKSNPEEGLFRVPGRQRDWTRVLHAILRNPDRAKEALSRCSVHDVCSILKQLLRNIQEENGTLLSKQLYDSFVAARDANAVRQIVNELPAKNKTILMQMSYMIKEVCENERTRMTTSSFATVISPNLVLHEGSEQMILQRMMSNNMKVSPPEAKIT